jgi:hypothetical protein
VTQADFKLPKENPRRIIGRLLRRARFLVLDRVLLIEAFFVALSIHVLLFPVLWVMGWALPWPKSPVIQTIIEYDLRNWPAVNKPKRIFNVRPPELNQP